MSAFILSPFLRLLFLFLARIISVRLHMHIFFFFLRLPLILLLVLVNSDWLQQDGIQPNTQSCVADRFLQFKTSLF